MAVVDCRPIQCRIRKLHALHFHTWYWTGCCCSLILPLSNSLLPLCFTRQSNAAVLCHHQRSLFLPWAGASTLPLNTVRSLLLDMLLPRWKELNYVQGEAEKWAPGLVNVVPFVAHHFDFNLPKKSHNMGPTF